MKKVMGVYLINNILTGAKYVGSSINIDRRKREHFKHLKSNMHCNPHLQRSYDKHGRGAFSFTILEQCERECLKDRESYWIYVLDCINNGYNMKDAADIYEGQSTSEETKRKISDKLKEHFKNNGCPLTGRKWTDEYREKRKNEGGKPSGKKPKRVVVLNNTTGEYINSYDSIRQICEIHGFDKRKVGHVLSQGGKKPKYSYHNLIFVYEENYIQGKDYRHIQKKRVRKIKEKVEKKIGPRIVKWHPGWRAVIVIDSEDNEMEFDNLEKAASFIGTKANYIHRYFREKRLQHKGYRFRYK